MRKLSLVFAVILVAIGLQELGVGANRLVIHSNDNRMPVLVLTANDGLVLQISDSHRPLTLHTKYKLLSDIIIVPFFHGWELDWMEASVGDELMDAGGFVWFLIWFSLPAYPLFLLGRWVWRTK